MTELAVISLIMDVDKFVRSVKLKYKERRLNREKQWPPCKSEKLVRLELVQSEGQSTTQLALTRGRDLEDKEIKRIPLAYSDLFKAERGKKPVRKVLVDGDAGIGKTTLCTALSEDWGNEKLFTQFRLLLLLPLRHKRVASASSLSELLSLLHSSEAVRAAVASYMEEGEGENVLIVADGWDELSEVERREGSFLYELLFGEQFCLMSVVVTSRPSASGPLHRLPCIDRFVEVRGFNKDNIKEYIQCEFDGEEAKASDLLEELESNPIVESVCSVPLNCAILCHLWRTLEGALPTTMTELYTKIIVNVILRNIRKIPEYSQVMSLSQFDALPESLQQWWWCLCELAFRALEKDKIVFSHEEFVTFLPQGLPLDDKVLCFGLLQRCESILEVGLGVSFHFLHLTFQEYLAALHIARQSPDIQIQCCSSLAGAPRFNMVWRFFFGISKFCSTVCARAQEEIINCITNNLTLYHCSFEAQGTSICAVIQDYSYSSFGVTAHSSYDCSAIAHVIANTQENNDMLVSFRHCGAGDKQIRALADALASKKGKLQVRQLHLDGNMLSDGCVSYLFLKASQSLLSLVVLNLSKNRIGSEGVKSALAVLSRSSVGGEGVSFFICDNPLGISGMNELRNAIVKSKGRLRFKALDLAGSLTDNEHTNAEWLHSFEHSLSKSILRSGELSLSRNRLGMLGAKALGKIIPQDFSIPRDITTPSESFYLDLSETMLGDEGVAAFTKSIAGVCIFSFLDLGSNNIHAVGLKHLADCIHQGKIDVKRFILNSNPLKLEGVVALLQSDVCRLVSLGLSGCELTTAGSKDSTIDSLTCSQPLTCTNVGQFIRSQLLRADLVQSLYLSNNSFSGDKIHILVGFLYLCPQLGVLRCKNCEITSDDLKELFFQVSSNSLRLHLPKFLIWYLGDNDIDDDGVPALTHLLQHFPNLIAISLVNNRLSHRMSNHLAKELQCRRELQRHRELQRRRGYYQVQFSCHYGFFKL